MFYRNIISHCMYFCETPCKAVYRAIEHIWLLSSKEADPLSPDLSSVQSVDSAGTRGRAAARIGNHVYGESYPIGRGCSPCPCLNLLRMLSAMRSCTAMRVDISCSEISHWITNALSTNSPAYMLTGVLYNNTNSRHSTKTQPQIQIRDTNKRQSLATAIGVLPHGR